MGKVRMQDLERDDVEYNAITADECYDCHRALVNCGRCKALTCLSCRGFVPGQNKQSRLCKDCREDDYATDLMLDDLREMREGPSVPAEREAITLCSCDRAGPHYPEDCFVYQDE